MSNPRRHRRGRLKSRRRGGRPILRRHGLRFNPWLYISGTWYGGPCGPFVKHDLARELRDFADAKAKGVAGRLIGPDGVVEVYPGRGEWLVPHLVKL